MKMKVESHGLLADAIARHMKAKPAQQDATRVRKTRTEKVGSGVDVSTLGGRLKDFVKGQMPHRAKPAHEEKGFSGHHPHGHVTEKKRLVMDSGAEQPKEKPTRHMMTKERQFVRVSKKDR